MLAGSIGVGSDLRAESIETVKLSLTSQTDHRFHSELAIVQLNASIE